MVDAGPAVGHRRTLIKDKVRSVSGHFVILLYPQRKGQPMPVTVWNQDRSQVTITIGDQKDVVDFAMTESGRTKARISRNGEEIVRID